MQIVRRLNARLKDLDGEKEPMGTRDQNMENGEDEGRGESNVNISRPVRRRNFYCYYY